MKEVRIDHMDLLRDEYIKGNKVKEVLKENGFDLNKKIEKVNDIKNNQIIYRQSK